jgi:hypothetical protein
MNSNKRAHSSTERQSTKRAKVTSSKSSGNQSGSTSGKVKFNKETFLRNIKNLKLYVDGDQYYDRAKVKVGPLELDWN